MPDFPSSKKDSGTGLRLRMLVYFIVTVVAMVTLAGYALHLHSKRNARLLELRVAGYDLRELHGKVTHSLDRELRSWKDLLLRGAEQGLYHELLTRILPG